MIKRLFPLIFLFGCVSAHAEFRWSSPFILLYTTNTFNTPQTFLSSITVTMGTTSFNGQAYVWPSTAPAQGQHLMVNQVLGSTYYLTWGGDAVGGGGGGSGGSDNFGSHVATRPTVHSGFAINYATAVTVGTYTYNGAGIAVSTTPDSIRALVSLGTGTVIYDMRIDSFTVFASTSFFQNVVAGSRPVDGVMIDAGSITVRGNGGQAGGISADTYTVKGVPIVVSTWNVRGYDGFIIRVTSGSIAANTTLSITATNLGFSVIGIPVCGELEGVNTAGTSIRLKDTLSETLMEIYNSDVVNAKKWVCHVPGRL